MDTAKHSARRDTFALRLRQKQLGRDLRLMYEEYLREPIPAEMLDTLRRVEASSRDIPNTA
ncbi:MAG TPA: NepR family anti-sigma factor [Rhizomicrobium sp.]|jgi:hypothetical protein